MTGGRAVFLEEQFLEKQVYIFPRELEHHCDSLICVIFSLCAHEAQSLLLSALVILCHSGRDEYLLLYGYFPETLRILGGNWFFSSALSLHMYSGGSQSSSGGDLCFIVTVEP